MKLVASDCPTIIRWELHNQCNLSCPHCRHHALEKRNSEAYPQYYKEKLEFTREDIDQLLDEVAPYKPSFTLNVANEPTIGNTFPYALKAIKSRGLSGTFNTNGLRLTEELCTLLVDIEWDSVTISIDATTPESLMKSRGIPFLDQVHAAVFKLLKARGNRDFPRIGVTFVDCDYNHHELDEFVSYWTKHVDFIRTTGYIQDLTPDIAKIGGDHNKNELPAVRLPCKQLFTDMVLRANGDVTRCVITSESPNLSDTVVGNIFDDGGVLKVWQNSEFLRLRNIHNSGCSDSLDYCSTCDYWVETQAMEVTETSEHIIRKPSPYTTFYNVKSKINNWETKSLHDRQGLIVDCVLE